MTETITPMTVPRRINRLHRIWVSHCKVHSICVWPICPGVMSFGEFLVSRGNGQISSRDAENPNFQSVWKRSDFPVDNQNDRFPVKNPLANPGRTFVDENTSVSYVKNGNVQFYQDGSYDVQAPAELSLTGVGTTGPVDNDRPAERLSERLARITDRLDSIGERLDALDAKLADYERMRQADVYTMMVDNNNLTLASSGLRGMGDDEKAFIKTVIAAGRHDYV